MNIKSYIESSDFDGYQLFFRENKSFATTFIDIGEHSKLIDSASGEEIPNGIKIDQNIPPSFTLIEKQGSPDFIQSLVSDEQLNFFPNKKESIYDCLVVLTLDDKTAGFLNISLKEKICRNEENSPIDISLEFVEKLAAKLKSAGVDVFKNYLPPSIAVLDQWRHYKFPFELYRNPIFEVFESSINSGLFAVNWDIAKLEIIPVDGVIKPEQIQKVQNLENNRINIRKQLLDKFWDEYQQWKEEFELPTLTEKEQLFGLIKLSTITIESDVNFSIQLFFRTWDDEHGQFVRCINNESIEFA